MSNRYTAVLNELKKPAPNTAQCSKMLHVLRMDLTSCKFEGEKEPNNSTYLLKHLIKFREKLETNVERSITIKDYAAFERYMAHLNIYYFDYCYLESSKHMSKFIGLNLLYMLATNRLADLFKELKRLPPVTLHTDEFIKFCLDLLKYYRDRKVNEIEEAKNTVPSEIYSSVIDMLVKRTRQEMEKFNLNLAPE